MLDELAFNVEGDLSVGIDFSGLKVLMLRAAQLLFEKGLFEIPSKVRGIGWQLARYDLPDERLAQDIVATILQTSWWLSETFSWEVIIPQGLEDKVGDNSTSRGARPLSVRYALRRIGR